jgi:hypothetical protein
LSLLPKVGLGPLPLLLKAARSPLSLLPKVGLGPLPLLLKARCLR